MKSRTKGLAWSYLYTVVNMISGLFLSAYLLRSLGDTEYGIYQTISSFANCLVMFEFGVGTVLTKNIVVCRSKNASREEINRNISTIWGIAIALSALICVVALGLYLSIDQIYANSMTSIQIAYAKKIFLVTLAYLLASFMFQTVRSTALGFENYAFSSKINVVRVILRTILIVSLIRFSQMSIYIACVDAFLSIVLLLFTLFFCKFKFKVSFRFRYFSVDVFRASVGLCLALFIQSIVNQVNTNADKFLIGVFLSPEVVSLYGVGMYVFSVFSTLTTIPISMYAPSIISEISVNGLREGLYGLVLKAAKTIALIGGVVFFGFVVVGQPFIKLVYGDEYIVAWSIALILMGATYLNMITGAMNNVLDALNKRMFRSLVILATTCLNIVLTIWWLPIYGIIGAAVATAGCTIVGQVLFMGVYYSRKMKINLLGIYTSVIKDIVVFQVVAMAIACLIGWRIRSVLGSFLTGGIVYVLIFAILYFVFSQDGRRQIKTLLRRNR